MAAKKVGCLGGCAGRNDKRRLAAEETLGQQGKHKHQEKQQQQRLYPSILEQQ